MIEQGEKICPRCGSPKMKNWVDLDDEQKMLVKVLPLSTGYTLAERKKHRFCTRCWFELCKNGLVEA